MSSQLTGMAQAVGVAGVSTGDVPVRLERDTDVDAAFLIFAVADSHAKLTTFPVESRDGKVLATVTFDDQGRLMQVELLAASVQLSEDWTAASVASEDTARSDRGEAAP